MNGEPPVSVIPPASSLSQSPSTSLGIPGFLTNNLELSKTNLPPGHGSFERPTFKVVKSQGWKKSFVVVEITSSGHVFDKYQVHLNLKEETASVRVIEETLKEQLGFDVRVLDSKHLPIMEGERTTGKRRPTISKMPRSDKWCPTCTKNVCMDVNLFTYKLPLLLLKTEHSENIYKV